MNRRDLIKASAAHAAVALHVLGPRVARANLVGDVYIDPAVSGVGHAGTYADPYSTADALAYFSLLSGDLQGSRIRLRAGTMFVGRIAISGCDNYYLEPYGSGAAPIISNHVDITSDTATTGVTWTGDDGSLNGGTPTDDIYFVAALSGGETAITFWDGTDYVQCECRNSYADLIGALYACSEARYPSGFPFLQFWDSGTGRMWIRVPSGFDPNAATAPNGWPTVLRPVAAQSAIGLSGSSGVTLSDLIFQLGATIGLDAGAIDGLTLNRLEGRNIGGIVEGSQDVFSMRGASKANRATDFTMNACKAYRSMTRTSSHGLEISRLRNVTIDDFEARDIRLHGIEFWASNSEVTVRRMKARQTLTLMQFQPGDPDPADTLHDNILVQNCECVQRATYLRHGTGGSDTAAGHGIVVSDFHHNRKVLSDLRVYHNSFDLDGAYFLYGYIDGDASPGLGNNAVTFKGNVCRLSQLTNTGVGGLYCCAVATAAAEWTMDRNVYQFAVNPINKLAVGGLYASSLAGYQALWNANGSATNEGHSVVAGATELLYRVAGGTVHTADLSLMNQVVAAVGRGDPNDPDTPATDILGVARDASPDAGAYEYVIGSDSTPAPVDFQNQVSVAANQDIASATITITGLTRGAPISVTNGSYEVAGSGLFVTWPGTIYNGQALRARVRSASTPNTPATVIVTVGGLAITFTATTGASGSAGPDPFTFTEISGADLHATYISLPVTLTGITGPATISVSGATVLYSINSATVFTSSPGTVVTGDVIRAALTTGGQGGAPYQAVITINGVQGTFRVTTGEPP